jgi:NADH dehydrogenase FAD-containing subunit
MKNIIVNGSTFPAVYAALVLEKKFGGTSDFKIILLGKREFLLHELDLFSIAASNEELMDLEKIKKVFTLPIKEIIKGKNIEFIKGEIQEIDAHEREIILGNRRLKYDYLILDSDRRADLKVEGAKQHALPLFTLADALRIRNAINFTVFSERASLVKRNIVFAVVGAGFKGVEFASSLSRSLDYISWKNGYPRENLEVELFETENRVLPKYNVNLSKTVQNHLKKLNVRVHVCRTLGKVEKNHLDFFGGERMDYDVLIWAADSKPEINIKSESFKEKGFLPCNGHFQALKYPNILLIGNLLHSVLGQTRSYKNSIRQAEYIAFELPYLIKNKRPPEFKAADERFIVDVGEHWSVVGRGKFFYQGYFAFLISHLSRFNIFRKFLGFWKAIRF